MGAISVMLIRQLKKYWRSKARIIGSLGQPLLFLLALGFGLGSVFQQASGGRYVDFLAPGIIAMSILFTSVFSGIEILWDRQFGFLKETLVAPVARWRIMLGRTLGGATVAMIQGIIMLIITVLIGFKLHSMAWLVGGLVTMFLIALLFTTLGTAIAARMTDMQAFPLIMNFLIMPIFFLSGALFPLDNVPKAVSIIASINPLSYGVDALRYAFTGVSHFSFITDISVLVAVTAAIGAIGTYLFSKIEV